MPEFARAKAQDDPTAVAVSDGERLFAWAEVDEILNRAANLILAADLGSKRRIAVFAENAAETAFAHLGGLLGGASTVPVNFHLTADEAAYILSDSESRVVFAGPNTIDRAVMAAAEAGIDQVVMWGGEPPDGVKAWEDWLAEGQDIEPPMSTVARPNLLYTSGTTGRPKGTELPPTMFAGGADMHEHLEQLKTSGFAAFGTHLVVGPMYHTGPLSGMRLLVAGIPSVILRKFDAEATLAAIERHRCETAVMVPTHFVRLLALPDEVKERYDMSSLRLITHTGSKCPVEVKREMIKWWGPVFRDAYGASEVGTTCSITSEEWLEHPGSVGRSIPPFEALVVDDDDREVPPNTEGRLFFRDTTGRGIVYPNDPDKTAAAHIAPGVFSLGEIGYIDDDGYVFITDRFSDMIVSGGVNVYPAEAEQVLIEHPDVVDVACIGVPHPEMGEELKGLVVLASGASTDAAGLSLWCRHRLSHYKCPRSIEFVSDVGRNTMGKVNKRKLREAYWS